MTTGFHGSSRREADRYGWDRQRQEPRVIKRTIVDQSPPIQRESHQNHYIRVPTDQHNAAYSWAAEQLARKQPGTTTALEQLDSLIRQRLNGEP